MPRVVLVTGVRGYLGSRLCGQLSADPSVDRIVGVYREVNPSVVLTLLRQRLIWPGLAALNSFERTSAIP